jgi:hypothetical protein
MTTVTTEIKEKLTSFFKTIYDDEANVEKCTEDMSKIFETFLKEHLKTIPKKKTVKKSKSKKKSKDDTDSDSEDDGEGLRGVNGNRVSGFKAMAAWYKADGLGQTIIPVNNFKSDSKCLPKFKAYDVLLEMIEAGEEVSIGDIRKILKDGKEDSISINAIIWGMMTDKDRKKYLE